MPSAPATYSWKTPPVAQFRLAIFLAWTLLAGIAIIWEYHDNKEFMASNALSTARACIEKDLVFRRWAATHGGVYAPVTRDTLPNPWLHVPERDIATPSGRRLTLMNPAYMSRQIFEIGQTSLTVPQGHITSLKAIRPENAPDPWEARALKAFESGLPEFGEFLVMDGKRVYRYMRPLPVEKPCLQCHAVQGYREGMVRGGISVAILTAGLEQAMHHSSITHLGIIALIWLMGMLLIRSGLRRIGAVTATLTAERDNLSSVFDATPMPMLLFDERMEAVRVNAAFRDYCSDYDTLPDKRCGTILRCANALSAPQGCGHSSACNSGLLMRALREVLSGSLSVHGEVTIPQAEEDGSITEVVLLYGVEAVQLDGQSHALLSFTDISERKRMEEKLAASEREFRTLVENSPDFIVRYDQLCRRVYMNPAMERLAGNSASDLLGSPPSEAYVCCHEGGQQVKNAVEQVLEQGQPVEIELVRRESGATPRHFLSLFVPELTANGEVASVLSITREISSLRRAETQLQHAQKMESIGLLAGGVAHDFNNILSVIGGYAELLKLTGKGNHEAPAYVDAIIESVARGTELTRSLLAFSSRHEPQKQYDSLNLIVSNLKNSISRLLRSDIELSFTLYDGRLPVFVDRGQIEQVLINLMINARDAIAPRGRIAVSTDLTVVAEETASTGTVPTPGTYARVTVADNGTGMDDETVARIFEPFFTTKETGKGTGLGLAIVSGIVAGHSGHITVESSPGNGTVFRVYLPVYQGDTQPGSVPNRNSTELYGNETVLLADDEPNLLMVIAKMLTRYGYTVLTATDGVEALQVFEAHCDEIQAMITDMVMPRMNGLETIRLIRQKKPELPVILMSGHTGIELDEAGILFLPKPLQVSNLAEILRAVLDGAPYVQGIACFTGENMPPQPDRLQPLSATVSRAEDVESDDWL